MGFIGATKIGADALRQLASRQQAIKLHHVALGMDPLGFNRVEPGTLGGQQEGQHPHAFARLFDPSVVLAYPGAHLLGSYARKRYPRSRASGSCLA